MIKMDIEGGEPRAVMRIQKTLNNNPGVVLVSELNMEILQRTDFAAERYLGILESLGFTRYACVRREGLVLLEMGTENAAKILESNSAENIACYKT